MRAFTCAPGPDEATLAPYRGQHVALVMWGLRGDHRQAVVTVRSYSRMRREAVSVTRQAGVDTRQMLADIMPVTSGKGAKRRPVVVALANTSEVAAAVRRLTDAGLRVRSVVSPALALMSLARLRRKIAAGGAEAYVALEETTTAIALIRDGALIAARELEWGYQDEQRQVRSRDDVAARLAGAIEEFFGDCGAPPSAIAQVCVCGGLPELRSMTLALTERLDVEVEPLDSLFGVDASELPADDLRDRAVDMRLAWAAAADWNAPINFLRERRRRVVKATLTRAAIVAGVATGLGIAWRIQRSALLEPSKPQPKPQTAAAAPVVPRPVAPSRPPEPAPVPAPVAAVPPAATPPVPVAVQPTPVPVPPPAIVKPPAVAAQPPAKAPVPVPIPAPAQVTARPPLVLTPVPEPPRPAPAREPQTAPARPPSAVLPPPPAVTPARRPPPEETPLRFDATLGSILYGADRKLAIIDGRIVQVGDDVRGARVVEITPNSVLFRDREGRLRRLSLEDPGR